MKRIPDYSGLFDDTFVVLCSDALIERCIWATVVLHKVKGALNTIIMQDVSQEEVHKCGVVQTDVVMERTLLALVPTGLGSRTAASGGTPSGSGPTG
jgi:NDP-sugar pyrophosphorylase family protein